MQILIFISLQIINNTTQEEISVVLFHKLLSQFATSRLHYQFLHLITAVTLCSCFSFALPPTLFLILLPNTPAQRSGQPQHLPLPNRAQTHTHTPAATPLHGGGQDRSSSKMTTHLQLSPCLQKSPTVFSSPLGGPARAGVGPHDLPACLQTDWQLPALPQKLS